MTLYRVTLKSVTAGVVVSPDGVVVEAAPVFIKFIGARFLKFCAWITRHGGTVNLVGRQT